jgi:hyperosmotically inducible protein
MDIGSASVKLSAMPPPASAFKSTDSQGGKMINKLFAVLALVTITLIAQSVSQKGEERIAREVRHELVMLPYYDVFDNLTYRVDGSKVTLSGQVTRPTLKSDAENVVKKIEGVETVDNQIEVLPVSPNDDRIRLATYRAIYSKAPLQRYQLGAVPPIHFIVKNGNVTLEGVVAAEGDKNLAGIAAKGVRGAFGVTNNLRVEK